MPSSIVSSSGLVPTTRASKAPQKDFYSRVSAVQRRNTGVCMLGMERKIHDAVPEVRNVGPFPGPAAFWRL